jgi:hypothetical protein
MNVYKPVPMYWKMPSLAFPDGIIAGGSVRDFLLGVEPRDTDLFVKASPETANAIALLGAQPVTPVNCGPASDQDDEGYIMRTDATYLYENGGGGPPLNIVVLAEPPEAKALLAEFDFGVCMAGWSAKAGFVIRDEFFTDAAQKTFTWMSSRRRQRSQERYAKFVQRPHFRDWRLVGLTPLPDPEGAAS